MLTKSEFIKLVSKHAHAELFKNINALNYLTFRREITLESIKEFSIGYLNESIISDFLSKNNLQEDALEHGLISPKNNRAAFNNHVVVPIIDSNKNYVGIYGRLVGEGSLNHMNLHGMNKNCFFNQSVLDSCPAIIITESIIDAITLNQYGFNAIASMGACLKEQQIELLRDKIVYILFDLDESGINATKTLCGQLWGVAKKIYPIKFPCYTTFKVDANSYFCKYKTARGTLQTIIKNSLPFSGTEFGLRGKKKKIERPNQDYDIVKLGEILIPNRLHKEHGFWCKCPLHKAGNERTRSMFVGGMSTPKNIFYCFGCGQGGGSVYFVSKVLTAKGKPTSFQEAEQWIQENLARTIL